MKTNETFPDMGMDPTSHLLGARSYQNYGIGFDLNLFPVASDEELLLHYIQGSVGPFIDLLVYTDLGVGWTLKPVFFEDEVDGKVATELVNEELQKRDFQNTMIQFATYYLVLGRACLVKTYSQDGGLYFNANADLTGIDCINPLTLDIGSIKNVMLDVTGEVEYIQRQEGKAASFSQDRVIYRTNNNFSRHAVLGHSPLQRCVTDLRLINSFQGIVNVWRVSMLICFVWWRLILKN